MIYLIFEIFGWIVCGILAWGITLADFYADFEGFNTSRDHYGISALMAVGGPVGLFVSFISSNFCQHGLKWK